MSALLNRIPWRTWQPKLFQDLATYDRRALIADVIAGLTVGVVALPLAMAFGADPDRTRRQARDRASGKPN